MDTPRELMEKMDAFENLKDSIARRIAEIKTPEEQRELDSLVKRAFSDECEFDKKHKVKLLALVIAPREVSWHFKLRERLHRVLHHH